MSIYEYVRGLGLGLMVATGMAAGASAAVLSESDVEGGAFGGNWETLTEVGVGFTSIMGTGSGTVYDNFVFTALPKGAQTITLEFSAPAGIDNSNTAGVAIFSSETAFLGEWQGTKLGEFHLQVKEDGKDRTTGPLALELSEKFGGRLYLALNFTHGKDISYTLFVPSNAVVGAPPAPAPVPVPAGLLLIGTALGGLALVRARSRRKPA